MPNQKKTIEELIAEMRADQVSEERIQAVVDHYSGNATEDNQEVEAPEEEEDLAIDALPEYDYSKTPGLEALVARMEKDGLSPERIAAVVEKRAPESIVQPVEEPVVEAVEVDRSELGPVQPPEIVGPKDQSEEEKIAADDAEYPEYFAKIPESFQLEARKLYKELGPREAKQVIIDGLSQLGTDNEAAAQALLDITEGERAHAEGIRKISELTGKVLPVSDKPKGNFTGTTLEREQLLEENQQVIQDVAELGYTADDILEDRVDMEKVKEHIQKKSAVADKKFIDNYEKDHPTLAKYFSANDALQMSNSIEVAGTTFGGVDEQDKFLRSGLYRTIFGDERVDRWIKNKDTTLFGLVDLATEDQSIPQMKMDLAFQQLQEAHQQRKVGEFTKSEDNFLPALFDATLQVVSSVGAGVKQPVTGLFDLMAAPAFIEANQEEADKQGKTLQEIVFSDDAKVVAPMVFASAMTMLESYGLGKAGKFIFGSGKGKGVLQSLRGLAGVMTAEGWTEWWQTGLEAANKEWAKDASVLDTSEELVKAMFSREGLEAFLKGSVGAGTISAPKVVLDGVSGIRANSAEIEEKGNDIVNLEDAKYNVDISEADLENINSAQENIRAEVSDLVKEPFRDLSNINRGEMEVLNGMNELVVSKTQSIFGIQESTNLTEDQKATAVASLEAEINEITIKAGAVIEEANNRFEADKTKQVDDTKKAVSLHEETVKVEEQIQDTKDSQKTADAAEKPNPATTKTNNKKIKKLEDRQKQIVGEFEDIDDVIIENTKPQDKDGVTMPQDSKEAVNRVEVAQEVKEKEIFDNPIENLVQNITTEEERTQAQVEQEEFKERNKPPETTEQTEARLLKKRKEDDSKLLAEPIKVAQNVVPGIDIDFKTRRKDGLYPVKGLREDLTSEFEVNLDEEETFNDLEAAYSNARPGYKANLVFQDGKPFLKINKLSPKRSKVAKAGGGEQSLLKPFVRHAGVGPLQGEILGGDLQQITPGKPNVFNSEVNKALQDYQRDLGEDIAFVVDRNQKKLGQVGEATVIQTQDGPKLVIALGEDLTDPADVGHEVFHTVAAFIKEQSPSTYTELLNRAKGDQKLLQNARTRVLASPETYGTTNIDATVEQEAAADLYGQILEGKRKSKADQNILQRALQAIKDFIRNVFSKPNLADNLANLKKQFKTKRTKASLQNMIDSIVHQDNILANRPAKSPLEVALNKAVGVTLKERGLTKDSPNYTALREQETNKRFRQWKDDPSQVNKYGYQSFHNLQQVSGPAAIDRIANLVEEAVISAGKYGGVAIEGVPMEKLLAQELIQKMADPAFKLQVSAQIASILVRTTYKFGLNNVVPSEKNKYRKTTINELVGALDHTLGKLIKGDVSRINRHHKDALPLLSSKIVSSLIANNYLNFYVGEGTFASDGETELGVEVDENGTMVEDYNYTDDDSTFTLEVVNLAEVARLYEELDSRAVELGISLKDPNRPQKQPVEFNDETGVNTFGDTVFKSWKLQSPKAKKALLDDYNDRRTTPMAYVPESIEYYRTNMRRRLNDIRVELAETLNDPREKDAFLKDESPDLGLTKNGFKKRSSAEFRKAKNVFSNKKGNMILLLNEARVLEGEVWYDNVHYGDAPREYSRLHPGSIKAEKWKRASIVVHVPKDQQRSNGADGWMGLKAQLVLNHGEAKNPDFTPLGYGKGEHIDNDPASMAKFADFLMKTKWKSLFDISDIDFSLKGEELEQSIGDSWTNKIKNPAIVDIIEDADDETFLLSYIGVFRGLVKAKELGVTPEEAPGEIGVWDDAKDSRDIVIAAWTGDTALASYTNLAPGAFNLDPYIEQNRSVVKEFNNNPDKKFVDTGLKVLKEISDLKALRDSSDTDFETKLELGEKINDLLELDGAALTSSGAGIYPVIAAEYFKETPVFRTPTKGGSMQRDYGGAWDTQAEAINNSLSNEKVVEAMLNSKKLKKLGVDASVLINKDGSYVTIVPTLPKEDIAKKAALKGTFAQWVQKASLKSSKELAPIQAKLTKELGKAGKSSFSKRGEIRFQDPDGVEIVIKTRLPLIKQGVRISIPKFNANNIDYFATNKAVNLVKKRLKAEQEVTDLGKAWRKDNADAIRTETALFKENTLKETGDAIYDLSSQKVDYRFNQAIGVRPNLAEYTKEELTKVTNAAARNFVVTVVHGAGDAFQRRATSRKLAEERIENNNPTARSASVHDNIYYTTNNRAIGRDGFLESVQTLRRGAANGRPWLHSIFDSVYKEESKEFVDSVLGDHTGITKDGVKDVPLYTSPEVGLKPSEITRTDAFYGAGKSRWGIEEHSANEFEDLEGGSEVDRFSKKFLRDNNGSTVQRLLNNFRTKGRKAGYRREVKDGLLTMLDYYAQEFKVENNEAASLIINTDKNLLSGEVLDENGFYVHKTKEMFVNKDATFFAKAAFHEPGHHWVKRLEEADPQAARKLYNIIASSEDFKRWYQLAAREDASFKEQYPKNENGTHTFNTMRHYFASKVDQKASSIVGKFDSQIWAKVGDWFIRFRKWVADHVSLQFNPALLTLDDFVKAAIQDIVNPNKNNIAKITTRLSENEKAKIKILYTDPNKIGMSAIDFIKLKSAVRQNKAINILLPKLPDLIRGISIKGKIVDLPLIQRPGLMDLQVLLNVISGSGKNAEVLQQFFSDTIEKPYARVITSAKNFALAAKQDFNRILKETGMGQKTSAGNIIRGSKLHTHVKEFDLTVGDIIRMYLVTTDSNSNLPNGKQSLSQDAVELLNIGEDKNDFKGSRVKYEGAMEWLHKPENKQYMGFANELLKRIAPSGRWTQIDAYGKTPGAWKNFNFNHDLQKLSFTDYLKEELYDWRVNKIAIFGNKHNLIPGTKLSPPLIVQLEKIDPVYGPKIIEQLNKQFDHMEKGGVYAEKFSSIADRFILSTVGAILFVSPQAIIGQIVSVGSFFGAKLDDNIISWAAGLRKPQYYKDVYKMLTSPDKKARWGYDLSESISPGLGTYINSSDNTNNIDGLASATIQAVSSGYKGVIKQGILGNKGADLITITIGGAFKLGYLRERLKKSNPELSATEIEQIAWDETWDFIRKTQQGSDPDITAPVQINKTTKHFTVFGNAILNQMKQARNAMLNFRYGSGNPVTELRKGIFMGPVLLGMYAAWQSGAFWVDWDDDDEEANFWSRWWKNALDSMFRGYSPVLGSVLRALHNSIEAVNEGKGVIATEREFFKSVPVIGYYMDTIASLWANSVDRYSIDPLNRINWSDEHPDAKKVAALVQAATVGKIPANKILYLLDNFNIAMDEQATTKQSIGITFGQTPEEVGLGYQMSIEEEEALEKSSPEYYKWREQLIITSIYRKKIQDTKWIIKDLERPISTGRKTKHLTDDERAIELKELKSDLTEIEKEYIDEMSKLTSLRAKSDKAGPKKVYNEIKPDAPQGLPSNADQFLFKPKK